jgi:DNA-3-methyladenine glycosylase
MKAGRVLPRGFFKRTAPEVARDLLGAVIISRVGGREVSGRISEVEAYLGRDDPASHAWNGRRHAQNEGLYRPAGWWYVYLSYGMHWCANLVCTPPGLGSAVLLRAMIPTGGVEIIRRRRGPVLPRDYSNGPGKLTTALGMTRVHDQRPMRTSEVVVHAASVVPDGEVVVTPRIGITRAVEWPLRFLWRPAGSSRPGSRGASAQ